MRVANYYRVSTKLQEKRFSLQAQQTELIAYVERQSWELVAEFTDVESGGKLDKAGLNALLDTVEEGRIDIVLCMNQDRLSRLDTVSWELLKSVLRENNVKIAEPNGTLVDLSNDDHVFVSDLKNLIAQREKKQIVKKMMYGKRQRLREGKGWGQGPFEYEYDHNSATYKIKPGWGWVIPLIDELYLEKQWGMTLIANKLNTISRTPTGGMWNEHLIDTRLKSKAFHGVQEKVFETGETIATPGVYEPMRTEETYWRLQEECAKRKEQFSITGRKNTDNIHLLKRSKITCGKCGRLIFVAQHGYKNSPRYYLKHGRSVRLKDRTRCDISINTVRIDDNIMEALKQILKSEELAKQYINIDYDENEIMSLKRNISNLENSIKQMNESMDRLLELYLSGSRSKEAYQKKEKEMIARLNEEKALLEQYKKKLEQIDLKGLSYENLYEYLEILSNLDRNLTNLEKAQLMGKVFPEGILYDDKLILTTTVFKGIPIDMTVPIGPDPFPNHFSKKKSTR